MAKRVFLIVFDSFGIGGAKDAKAFGDEGSNTLKSISKSDCFNAPNLTKMGLFNIDGIDFGKGVKNPIASFGRAEEVSAGKDSTTGHWEIAGIVSKTPFPTFPNGFPDDLIEKLEKVWGRKIIVNKPYSGTDVIRDYGKEHIKTGNIIVYTSGDSVLQVAVHDSVASVQELYKMCEQARKICTGKYAVGRVIARPFVGEYPNFVRTHERLDFSLTPPKETILNKLQKHGKKVIGIGKINALFNGYGIDESYITHSDSEGMEETLKQIDNNFNGLCFVNLVDFDTEYGHRNNVDGYATNLSNMDIYVGKILNKLHDDDMLIITADHGCDPKTLSTDHSRENIPVLVYQKNMKGEDLGTLNSFAEVGKIAYNYLIND